MTDTDDVPDWDKIPDATNDELLNTLNGARDFEEELAILGSIAEPHEHNQALVTLLERLAYQTSIQNELLRRGDQ